MHTVLNVGTLVGGLAKSAGGLLRRTPKVEPIPPRAPEAPPPAALPEPVPPKMEPPRTPETPPTQGVKVKRNSAEGAKYGEEVAHARMKELGYERIDKGGEYVHGHKGIDGVYRNPNPPPDYVIIDAKYNTAQLGVVKEGYRQMSDRWIRERLGKAVDEANAAKISRGLNDSSVLRIVIKVSEDGKTAGKLVDKNGCVILGNKGKWSMEAVK